MITLTEAKNAVPMNLRDSVDQPFVDKLNNIVSDPDLAESIRDNFITYSSVLQTGKYKTADYVSAVMYVSFKMMNMSNQDAYIKTFPQRFARLQAEGATPKEISAHVAMYNKGKLVNAIMERSLIPPHVLNQDIFQKAIMVQAELMQSAESEKVRCEAANSLLTHLAKPKDTASTVQINVGESPGLNEVRIQINKLAEAQREQMMLNRSSPGSGMNIIDVLDQNLIGSDGNA